MNNEFQALIQSVNKILNDVSSDMVDTVIQRLVSFGVVPTDADAWMIAYSIKGAVNHTLNQTNCSEIPDGLFEVVVDMACGEILNAKALSGQLEMSALDLIGSIQSVTQGDTSVSFGAEDSDEAKLKALIAWLMQGKGCDFLCFRKMRW